MAQIGEIIDGKYEVLREIGRGGMSVVYLAMDKRLNKQWAIKEFRKDKDDVSKQVALKALLDEANLMKKLDHPTLPRIVDIIDEHATVYVVMDYIEGESLNKVLDAYGAQPQEAVIEWAKQLSNVLDYLHTQTPPVIYRDMKPANIMLKPDGTVRLIDFGIAREYKEGKDGDTEAIGTRGYAAPEQFGGKGQTDARTDIYSLGVTLYHLVTGKNPAEPPYEIYPIRHWDPTLSSGFEWLIQKCTQLNPGDRYQSCAEVTYVLENLDKFEGEYKRKQKSRISLFMVAAIMSVVFAISSGGSFIGASQVAKQTYEGYMELDTIDGYAQAINANKENPEAYLKLVEKLREQISVIKVQETEGETLAANEILVGDLMSWFPAEQLNQLRETHPKEYVAINYELGRLYWNCCEGDNAIIDASQYFGSVLTTAEKVSGKFGGLDPQKYNLAKVYYLVAYFQNNKDKIGTQDDGEFIVSDKAAKVAGIYGITESGSIDNPYYSFWRTCDDLLELIDMDQNVSDVVRMKSMEKLSYILAENYDEFFNKTQGKDEKVEGEDMLTFYNDFRNLVLEVSQTTEQEEAYKKTVKRLNDIRPALQALYDIELEGVS